MEIAERNYHLKLQEMCDCFLETDFRKQLQGMIGTEGGDLEESAVKYLALAIMNTVTENARNLTFKKKNGKVQVTVKSHDKTSLPAPSEALFDKVVEIVRAILHLEEDKGKMPLSLGLRSGDLEVQVKVSREPNKESVKFMFS